MVFKEGDINMICAVNCSAKYLYSLCVMVLKEQDNEDINMINIIINREIIIRIYSGMF